MLAIICWIVPSRQVWVCKRIEWGC